ncbi:MAG: energy transducer TonB [Bacteroidota bacterium]|nr:energy transducer TonB [Bacteroidota bacterium]
MYEGEPLPVTALELGQVHVSDNGFSVNCDLLSVIDLAKRRASELGGNVIYINNIKLPDFYSTCHRIEATVYKIDSVITNASIQDMDKEEVDETKEIKAYIETQPEFPGGINGLNLYIRKHFSYPESALKDKTGGIVIIQFVVDKTAKTTDEEEIKSVRPDLDNEAVRLISMFPEWKPGFQNNKTVNVKYTLPITFTPPTRIIKKRKA